jgi:hypothetical protein
VNVIFNSSWCLFQTEIGTEEHHVDNPSDESEDDEEIKEGEDRRLYRPSKFSGRNYSFD